MDTIDFSRVHRLRHFFKNDAPPHKRVKALLDFVAQCSSEEREKFHRKHYFTVYGVVLDALQKYDYVNRHKNELVGVDDALLVLEVLENLMQDIHDVLQKKWQARSIGNLVTQLLARDNHVRLRKKGLQILLQFIDIVGDRIEGNMFDVLSRSVNFAPFSKSSNYSNDVRNFFSALSLDSHESLEFCRATYAQTPYISTQLLECIFGFVLEASKRCRLSFWMQTLKKTILPMLYPDAFNVLTGFRPFCPPAIQYVVIRWLNDILTIRFAEQDLWADQSTVTLILEIFRQSMFLVGYCALPWSGSYEDSQGFYLPVRYSATCEIVLSLYRGWIVGVDLPAPFQEGIEKYFSLFIEHTLPLFDIGLKQTPESDWNDRTHMMAVSLYRLFLFEPRVHLSESTRETLFLTLLKIANILHKSPASSNADAPMVVTDALLDVLIECYLQSCVSSHRLWEAFRSNLQSWMSWSTFIERWRIKLIELTKALVQKLDKQACDSSWLVSCESSVAAVKPPPDKCEAATQVDDFVQAFSLWDHLLHILGHPNHESPKIAELRYEAVFILLEIFLDASSTGRIQQKAALVAAGNAPKHVISPRVLMASSQTLMEIFAPWLFDICASSDAEKQSIRGKGFAALCRMFSMRSAEPFDQLFLAKFYFLMHQVLDGEEDYVKNIIFQESKRLFLVGLPGITILIPDFVREIENLVIANRLPNSDVIASVVSIITSLLPFPRYFEALALCNFPNAPSPSVRSIRDVLPVLKDLLHQVCTFKDNDIEVVSKSTWGLFLYLYEETLAGKVSSSEILSVVSVLFEKCSHDDIDIAVTGIEAMRNMSTLAPFLSRLDRDVITSIISGLTVTGIARLTSLMHAKFEDLQVFEAVACNAVLCLLRWVIECDELVFSTEHLFKGVFHLLNTGLSYPRSPIRKTPSVVSAGSASSSSTQAVISGQQIRDICEIALDHILCRVGNYPLSEGGAIIDSDVNETNDPMDREMSEYHARRFCGSSTSSVETEEWIHMMYGTSCLISFSERMTLSSYDFKPVPTARLIIRAATGKYAWDFSLSKGLVAGRELATQPKICKDLYTAISTQSANVSTTTGYKDKTEVNRELVGKTRNVLLDAFTFIEENFAEEELLETVPRDSFELRDGVAQDERLSEEVEEFTKREQELLGEFSGETECPVKTSPNELVAPVGMFDTCRFLLSSLHLLRPFDNLRTDSLVLLENNAKLERSLKLLDRNFIREVHKIGVIYVSDGQELQQEILCNQSGSPDYEAFVDALGWPVDVRSHRGFLGGLDPRESTGRYAPYFANSLEEVMFHVVTRMPTDWNDSQQILKKRQVGNDHVHIVWSEHCRDYLASTISSHFNDVHIVIYPMRGMKGYYRIQIHVKVKELLFGPLQDGMVVSSAALPHLVRLTAVNANLALRLSSPAYRHPCVTRKMYISDIIERHGKTQTSTPEFLSCFFPGIQTSSQARKSRSASV